jgi:hypothetical protein
MVINLGRLARYEGRARERLKEGAVREYHEK